MESESVQLAPRQPVSLTDVRRGDCRYIVDHETFPALCCAAPTRTGTSWCDTHCKLVYTRHYDRDRARQSAAQRLVT